MLPQYLYSVLSQSGMFFYGFVGRLDKTPSIFVDSNEFSSFSLSFLKTSWIFLKKKSFDSCKFCTFPLHESIACFLSQIKISNETFWQEWNEQIKKRRKRDRMKTTKKAIISMCQLTEKLNLISFHNINYVCASKKSYILGLQPRKVSFYLR